ncbi:hypothetical protein [Actinomadura rupiterrae]|uniref:hypothetical protein n=1 Tax=Actinomadura rupiterrae TaxID=559627 RepID=UPI0020A35B38|nr:hypothetical protein [Actinomadura rupiterrae]MCP2340643.1 hypothetical protein [Actinomadura rupiterrae]
MSLKMSIRRKPRQDVGSRLDRAQVAFRQGLSACRGGASVAAERIGPAARQSRVVAAERVLAARGWSAPRLKQAARYVETDLGPRVSSMLSDTAHRVEPPRRRRRARSVMVAMLAGATAACVAGVVLTRRNAAQTVQMMTDESTAEPADAQHADHVPSKSS